MGLLVEGRSLIFSIMTGRFCAVSFVARLGCFVLMGRSSFLVLVTMSISRSSGFVCKCNLWLVG